MRLFNLGIISRKSTVLLQDKQDDLLTDVMGGKFVPPMVAVMADDVAGERKACLDLGCGSGSW